MEDTIESVAAASENPVEGISKEQEYLEGWQRERAELQNFRKRTQEQALRNNQQALKAVLEPLLPVVDNFQAMMKHVPLELERQAWVAGVLHIARQVEQLLSEYGVRTIEALGQPFDALRHEAIESVVVAGTPSGQVVEVVTPGYLVGDEVIRPARVRIAS